MPRQTQPVITPKGPYPVLQPVAGALHFVFTPADVANFEEFAFTGKELILVTSTGSYTFTVESVADEKGRTGDITTYAIAAGEFACLALNAIPGWGQAGGKCNLKGSNAGVKFAIIRMPG
jgi:hypothetical protein